MQKIVRADDEIFVNPLVTFPIKKRTDSELLIDWTAAFFKLARSISEMIKKGDQPVKPTGFCIWQLWLCITQCIIISILYFARTWSHQVLARLSSRTLWDNFAITNSWKHRCIPSALYNNYFPSQYTYQYCTKINSKSCHNWKNYLFSFLL